MFIRLLVCVWPHMSFTMSKDERASDPVKHFLSLVIVAPPRIIIGVNEDNIFCVISYFRKIISLQKRFIGSRRRQLPPKPGNQNCPLNFHPNMLQNRKRERTASRVGNEDRIFRKYSFVEYVGQRRIYIGVNDGRNDRNPYCISAFFESPSRKRKPKRFGWFARPRKQYGIFHRIFPAVADEYRWPNWISQTWRTFPTVLDSSYGLCQFYPS